MIFAFQKKQIKMAFLVIAIVLGLAISISYFLSIKIHNSFFRSVDSKNIGFIQSYQSSTITYNAKPISVYSLTSNANPTYILYVPSKYGALNDVVTAISAKYGFYGFEYPIERQLQNFSSLLNITKAVIQTMIQAGIKPENIILFGHGIGANVAFEASAENKFMAVLMLNPLNNERSYCSQKFFKALCLTVRPSFSFSKYSNNLIYYFFNKNEYFAEDSNYDIFNLIKSKDKFLFEIPGEDINFNFNHIIDFYTNEGKTQLQIYETKSLIEDDPSIIDVDGYTNPDTYFD